MQMTNKLLRLLLQLMLAQSALHTLAQSQLAAPHATGALTGLLAPPSTPQPASQHAAQDTPPGLSACRCNIPDFAEDKHELLQGSSGVSSCLYVLLQPLTIFLLSLCTSVHMPVCPKKTAYGCLFARMQAA